MSIDNTDDPDNPDNDLMFALTWVGRDGRPLFWSLYHGWTPDRNKAWTLTNMEVDGIEDNEKLASKLPMRKDWRAGAEWVPLYKRFPLYGNTDDDLMSNLVSSRH